MSRSSILALIVFVVLVVVVLTMRSSVAQRFQGRVLEIVRPIHSTTATASSRLDAFNKGLKTLDDLESENHTLLVENEKLRATNEMMNDLAEQNNSLRQALDFKKRSNFNLLPARIISRQSSTWWNTVQIDRGEQDGLDSDMPVVTDVGLVGKTMTVASNTAVVLLVADENCKVAAYVEGAEEESGAKAQGIVSGERSTNGSQPELSFNTPSKNVHLAAGQKVFSAGIAGGVFPRGLLLGTVREFQTRALDIHAVLTPAVDLSRLENVFIIHETHTAAPAVPVAMPVATPAPARAPHR